MKRAKRVLLYWLIVAALVFGLTPQMFNLLGFPSHLKIIQGIEQSLKIHFPFEIYITCDDPDQLLINGEPLDARQVRVNLADPIHLQANTVGKLGVDFKLFGMIPVRHMEVNVVPELRVIPSGHSIGVVLHSDGVIVVEETWVDGLDGKRYYPAREAGIAGGDYLLEINGKKVYTKQDVASAVYAGTKNGSSLTIKVRKRSGEIRTVKVQPVQSQDGPYMIGLFIEDGIAGVGTMTFYDPASGLYGALGHVITDAHTQSPIQIRAGELVRANISGINSGQRGIPGEKLGTFMDFQDDVLGKISKNCDYGIYGTLANIPQNKFFNQPVPVATSRQIEHGPAWMYTVIEGGNVERFAVEIINVTHQSRPATKGLVIRVTDSRLLQLTGGIVQGMSGSPIVQNGRLVGAVTHVFVNDPKKGYGVLAEWMVKEAGIDRVMQKAG